MVVNHRRTIKRSQKGDYTLPAIHLGESEENSRIRSVQNQVRGNEFEKVIIDDKVYSTQDFLAIAYKIDSTYTMDIKTDSVTHGKILVIKKKP